MVADRMQANVEKTKALTEVSAITFEVMEGRFQVELETDVVCVRLRPDAWGGADKVLQDF